MYPSSSSSSASSSSHGSMGPTTTGGGGGGLTRYSSAPGSFLTTALDSVLGGAVTTIPTTTRDFSSFASHHHHPPRNYNGDTSSVTSESTCKANHNPDPKHANNIHSTASPTTRRPYGVNGIAAGINLNSKIGGGGGCGGSLVRHSSSPAGFLDHLSVYTNAATAGSNGNGFPLTRATGSYNSKCVSDSGHGISRLASQLSFTRQDPLSDISEESENGQRKAAHSCATASFGMSSWDDSNAIVFSSSPSKRAKSVSGDVVHCLNTAESQFQFSLSQTALDMATAEKFLQIPHDSVPCKIRAKRGFATHPRSIAERDRRTRINGKLKKLQDLVPNLEKQTSYADMLDLAVQHIKVLENQVQKLKDELENCTCGCKQNTQG